MFHSILSISYDPTCYASGGKWTFLPLPILEHDAAAVDLPSLLHVGMFDVLMLFHVSSIYVAVDA